MKKTFNKRLLGIFTLLLFSFSCTSNLDFNQVNTLKSTPVFVANFATFDAPASQFINVVTGNEIPLAGVKSNFDVFRDAYFNQSLTEADFAFEFTNTINKAYMVNLYFFDAAGATIFIISSTIPAGTTAVPKVVKQTQVFQNTRLDQLKTAKQIGFTVAIVPSSGPALTSTSTGNLKLRSSATVYLTLQ